MLRSKMHWTFCLLVIPLACSPSSSASSPNPAAIDAPLWSPNEGNPPSTSLPTTWFCYNYNLNGYLRPTSRWPWDWSGSNCMPSALTCSRGREEAIQAASRELKVHPSVLSERNISSCEELVRLPWCYVGVGTDSKEGEWYCSENLNDCQRAAILYPQAPMTACLPYDQLATASKHRPVLSCTERADPRLGAVCGLSLSHCERDAAIWTWRTKVDLGACSHSEPSLVWCGLAEKLFTAREAPVASSSTRPILTIFCASGTGPEECEARLARAGEPRSHCVQEQPRK